MTRDLGHKAGAALLRTAFSEKNASCTHTEALDLFAKLKGFNAWSHLQQALAKASKKKASGPTVGPVALAHIPLHNVLSDHYGLWGEYAPMPKQDWQYSVGNGDTMQGYWPWVASELVARDLWNGPAEFEPTSPTTVTRPDGAGTTWAVETDLTDRWGDLNDHAIERKPGYAVLQLDEALGLPEDLLESLRSQMVDEDTFCVRKDGVFGLLYEVEYNSVESDGVEAGGDPEYSANLKPYAEMVPILCRGLAKLEKKFPGIEMCVPEAGAVFNSRPGVWAFVPNGLLDEEKRKALALGLHSL